ncbi:MAG: 2-hydroxyacyl-CoA dehydratase [Ruminococcus flavefaciens]|nr:2-hydroxyacyl-CoA dehydratase [Ruminococcus flavefaciens]MCM1230329.1 2-hydroxyacyl-CoA dehydratase [Ruminococcus flavefaciens]
MTAVFTKEMKSSHTIVIPEMLEYHFPILKGALTADGYNVMVLEKGGSEAINIGKKYVNNDMCFPAIAIIGQFIYSVQQGICDPDRTAFLIPQTGGACRASNYFYLMRKALAEAGYPQIPVISLNLNGINSQPGFKISLKMVISAVISVLSGDLLMHLYQQSAPYACDSSEPEMLLKKWQGRLFADISSGKLCRLRQLIPIYRSILDDFSKIKRKSVPLAKIGLVGELYIKYCRTGNFNAEDFLRSNGAEVRTTGFAIYAFYVIQSIIYDTESSDILKKASSVLLKILTAEHRKLCAEVKKFDCFSPMPEYSDFVEKSGKVISQECITGDGWLVSAESAVLIECGFDKIICLNPFGCLVSHINCKGISGKIRRMYSHASVTNIECDSDTSPALYYSRLLMAME